MRIFKRQALPLMLSMAGMMASTQVEAEPAMPFRSAVPAGGLLFLSGQIGVAPPGLDSQQGMDVAAKASMDGVGRVLAANGKSFDDVVKCTIILADMALWDRFNAIYRTYFKSDRFPARSAFAVSGLALGAAVEVECIARDDANR